jgi:hypothetical protein
LIRNLWYEAQSKDLPEVIAKVRDAIGLMGIDMQDDGDGKILPIPPDPYSRRLTEGSAMKSQTIG